jgi:hypothetical protein
LGQIKKTPIDLGRVPDEMLALSAAIKLQGHIEHAGAVVETLGKWNNASAEWANYMEEIKNKDVTDPQRLKAAKAMGDWFASMGPLADLIPGFGKIFGGISKFDGAWFVGMAEMLDPILRKNAAKYMRDPDFNYGFVEDDEYCSDGETPKKFSLNPRSC